MNVYYTRDKTELVIGGFSPPRIGGFFTLQTSAYIYNNNAGNDAATVPPPSRSIRGMKLRMIIKWRRGEDGPCAAVLPAGRRPTPYEV